MTNFSIARSLLVFLVGIVAVFPLSGCGGTVSKGVAPPQVIYPDATGNWQVELEPATSAGVAALTFYKLTGSVAGSTSSPKVTATLQVYSSSQNPCTPLSTVVQATGTIDSSGNVHLTFPLAGGAASLDGKLDTNQGEIFASVQVSGGSCALSPNNALMYEVPSVTGTWSGVLQSSSLLPGPISTSNVTATLMQAATPSPDGSYLLTGNVASTGGCVGSFAFTTGRIAGDDMVSSPLVSSGSVPSYFLGGAPRVAFISIPIALVAQQGCSSLYAGALTRQ